MYHCMSFDWSTCECVSSWSSPHLLHGLPPSSVPHQLLSLLYLFIIQFLLLFTADTNTKSHSPSPSHDPSTIPRPPTTISPGHARSRTESTQSGDSTPAVTIATQQVHIGRYGQSAHPTPSQPHPDLYHSLAIFHTSISPFSSPLTV